MEPGLHDFGDSQYFQMAKMLNKWLLRTVRTVRYEDKAEDVNVSSFVKTSERSEDQRSIQSYKGLSRD